MQGRLQTSIDVPVFGKQTCAKKQVFSRPNFEHAARELKAQGWTAKKIAHLFRVRDSYVYEILRRKE
jgi:hypothetical protein